MFVCLYNVFVSNVFASNVFVYNVFVSNACSHICFSYMLEHICVVSNVCTFVYV